MKRINLLGTALLTIAVMTSCGSSKPVTQTVQQPTVQQDVEINVPCSGPEFQTNKEYLELVRWDFLRICLLQRKKR